MAIEGETPMFERLAVQQMAHDLAVHAASRQAVISRNVAHADTPGYRSRDLPDFATLYRSAGSAGDAAMRTTRAGHRGAETPAGSALPPLRPQIDPTAPQDPNGNSVSLEREMIRAVETRHQHDLALTVYRSVSGMLRSALG